MAPDATDPAIRHHPVIRVGPAGAASPTPDAIAAEEPLEIRLHDRSVAVVMRTPGRDADLVTGFLVTEGVVERAGDIADVGTAHDPRGRPIPNTLTVHLAPGVTVDLASLQRNLFASSSCGVCGKASIEGVMRRVEPLPDGPAVSAATLLLLPERMRVTQRGFAQSGGLHAAVAFDAKGQTLAGAEDVGRHNAVDKAIGALVRRGLGQAAILMVSGRVSFEVVQKATFARIPVVCAVSAPTSLAIDAARQANLTLVGFLRGHTFNVYAGAARLADIA